MSTTDHTAVPLSYSACIQNHLRNGVNKGAFNQEEATAVSPWMSEKAQSGSKTTGLGAAPANLKIAWKLNQEE